MSDSNASHDHSATSTYGTGLGAIFERDHGVAPVHEAPADRCPGLIRPYASNDGQLVRLRTAGVPLSLERLAMLADLAERHGDGTIQLTMRGALQLRALPDPLPEDLVSRVEGSGMIPTPSHELVRNVVVSPLTGLDAGGRADLRPMVAAYDEALRADAELAELPGRFLVVFDDGRGDVLPEHFDLAYQAHGRDHGAVYAGSMEHGWAVPAEDAVSALLALARSFVAARAAMPETDAEGTTARRAWHVRELPEELPAPWEGLPRATQHIATGRPPLGAVESAVADAAVVGVPLGLLTKPQADVIAQVAASVGAGEVVVTPWRSLVVPGAGHHLAELAAAGLVTGEVSAWSRVAACTGKPGCARADVDVQDLARRLVERIDGDGPMVYLSACERRCGSPTGDYVDVLRPTGLDEVLATVTAADRSARGSQRPATVRTPR